MRRILWVVVLVVPFTVAARGADDSDRLLTIDHYVRVVSTVPAIAGQPAQLYVRERVLAGGALRTSSFGDRVVLFVHGAGTPAEVAFDVPYQDYSWMAFLAGAGFDVFSRVRQVHTPGADERPVQSREGAAGRVRRVAVRGALSSYADVDRV